MDEQVEDRLVDGQAAALDDPPSNRCERIADVFAEGPAAVQEKAVVAPAMKPIAEAARYHTPTTFNRNVYTSSVSSVFDTPTRANFRNWTTSGYREL